MIITRFGHAALLVEVRGVRMLIDPGAFSEPQAFALTDLDAIVVTHGHPDHLDRDRVGGLVALNPDAVLLAAPDVAEELGAPWVATADGHETVLDEVTLTGVGARHAEILPALPRVDNVGLLVSAPGAPTLFHPGDSYETVPADVDVLALPLSAPWTKASETLAFLHAVAPCEAFPIHDRTVSDLGYGIYWNHMVGQSPAVRMHLLGQTDVLDLT